MSVRVWRPYVKYNGQPQTCRVCDLTGHFPKDCPTSKKPSQPESDASATGTQPGNTKSSEKPPENKDLPMETQSSKPVITQAEIIVTSCIRESSQEEFHIQEPDHEILQSCLDGIFDSISTDADDDIQSADSLEDEEEELPARNFTTLPVKDLTQATKDWTETQELPQELPALHKKDLVQDFLNWEKLRMRLRNRLVLSLTVLFAERILTLKLSVLLPEFGIRVREKVLMERTVSQVMLTSGRRKSFKSSGVILTRSWSMVGILMTFSM